MADRTCSILYIYYKTMSFLFNPVLYFPHKYHMVKEEKGNRCDLKKIKYNKVITNFFLLVSKFKGLC